MFVTRLETKQGGFLRTLSEKRSLCEETVFSEELDELFFFFFLKQFLEVCELQRRRLVLSSTGKVIFWYDVRLFLSVINQKKVT